MRQKNKNSMVVRIMCASLCSVCLLGLAGCGGNATGGSGNATYRSGIKEGGDGAVSDSAVQEEAAGKAEKLRYSSDTNAYEEYQDDDYEVSGIVQMRRDGTHQKKVIEIEDEESACALDYVDEHWLYYEIVGMDEIVLYRVPLEKDADGYDEVKVSEAEELFRDTGIIMSCWSSDDVIYEDGKGSIVKYDLQNKRRSGEWKESEFGGEEEKEFKFSRLKDSIIAFVQPTGVYVLAGDAASWKKCSESPTGYAHNVVNTENHVFFAEDTLTQKEADKQIHIWKCDGKAVQSFVTDSQIKQAVMEAKGIKEDRSLESCELTGIYAQNGRLYVQLELCQEEDGMCRFEYLIFSQGENETELHYERELVAAMQSAVKTRTGRWEVWNPDTDKLEKVCREQVTVNDARCIVMMNGKAFLCLYDYEKDRGRLGCYDLDTGELSFVTKEEAERNGLEYEAEEMENELLSVFDSQQDVNPFLNIEGVPATDKKREGGFYESEK